MIVIHTEEKKEIIRIRTAFKELDYPNVFDGKAYCVQVDDLFCSIKARKSIVRSMPYSGAYLGRINDKDGLYIIVDKKEKEERDRYPIPFIEKRYRDSKGELVLRINDLIAATREEALRYYQTQMVYLVQGSPAILTESDNGCTLYTETRTIQAYPRHEMGVFLPDVSNYGNEVIAFNDRRFLSAQMQNAIGNAAKTIVKRIPIREEQQHIR